MFATGFCAAFARDASVFLCRSARAESVSVCAWVVVATMTTKAPAITATNCIRCLPVTTCLLTWRARGDELTRCSRRAVLPCALRCDQLVTPGAQSFRERYAGVADDQLDERVSARAKAWRLA